MKNKNTHSMQSMHKNNQGLSLIEMMIAMVIGLFLIGGLMSMFLNSQSTNKVRNAVSDIEESARLTLNSLRGAIEHAGYRSVDQIPLELAFQRDGSILNPNCRDANTLVTNTNLITPPSTFSGYTKDGNVANNESDRITVIYRADNPNSGPVFFDCGGPQQAYFDTNAVVTRARQTACSTDPDVGMNNTWDSRIYNGLFVNKADKTLECYGSRSPTGSIVLADNIENMQIRYGVTRNNGAGNKITIFKKADDVDTTKSEWESVTSVQIAILVASDRAVLDKASAHSYQLLDETITLDSDRKLYRIFSTTINLPNRNNRELQTITRTSKEAT